MSDSEYKELLESWEETPPASAWELIQQTIQPKPWYATLGSKVAILAGSLVIVGGITYFGIQSQWVSKSQESATKQNNLSNAEVQNPQYPNHSVNVIPPDSKSAQVTPSGSNALAPMPNSTLADHQGTSNTKASSNPDNQVSGATGNSHKSPTIDGVKPPSSNSTSSNSSAYPVEINPSAKAVCVGKNLTLKLSHVPVGAILNMGDGHQMGLGSGNTVVNYSFAAPGVYSLQILQNQQILANTEVSVTEKVQAYFKTKVTENMDVEFTNWSVASNRFTWYFDDGTTPLVTMNPNQFNHHFTSSARQKYQVRLVAINTLTGCTDEFTLEVSNPGFKNYFFTPIPNVFTPNNDGLNDVFEIPVAELSEWHMLILNETGQVVFESNRQSNPWNGRVNNAGNDCGAGTYRYIIKYRQPDDEEMHQKSGYITLIRE